MSTNGNDFLGETGSTKLIAIRDFSRMPCLCHGCSSSVFHLLECCSCLAAIIYDDCSLLGNLALFRL